MILHVIKTQHVAGAENHLFMLLPGLREAGIEITLLNLEDDSMPAMTAEYSDALAMLEGLGITVRKERVRHALDAAAVPRLARIVAGIAPALVHTHLMYADLFAAAAARRANVPVVLASRHHDYSFSVADRLKFGLYYTIANRYHDAQIAISSRVRALLASEFKTPELVRLIRYGCTDQRVDRVEAKVAVRRELGLSSETIIAGTVARLITWKGHEYGLEALAKIVARVPNVKWLLIGDGPERSRLESLTDRLGLADQVYFLGHRRDVATLMAAMDLMIHPTTGEGFGLVFLEAMIQGTPIIASDTGAAPEIVKDGETGLLVAPRDSEALARAIARLASDAAYRAQLGTAGRERYERHFRAARMISETVSLYYELLEQVGART